MILMISLDYRLCVVEIMLMKVLITETQVNSCLNYFVLVIPMIMREMHMSY